MNDTIYLVMQGEYSDKVVVGFFDSHDDAHRYAIVRNRSDDGYHVEECRRIDAEIEQFPLYYEHEVVFDLIKGVPRMRKGEDARYDVYAGERRKTRGSYHANPRIYIVRTTTTSREKAEKIACDIVNRHFDTVDEQWVR